MRKETRWRLTASGIPRIAKRVNAPALMPSVGPAKTPAVFR